MKQTLERSGIVRVDKFSSEYTARGREQRFDVLYVLRVVDGVNDPTIMRRYR